MHVVITLCCLLLFYVNADASFMMRSMVAAAALVPTLKKASELIYGSPAIVKYRPSWNTAPLSGTCCP
jgi:hypothetical protein